jgi:hypothetical protein
MAICYSEERSTFLILCRATFSSTTLAVTKEVVDFIYEAPS